MKRQDVVNKLLKEGFSEKTLVNFSDKQLDKLVSILSEQNEIPKGAVRMKKNKTMPDEVKRFTDSDIDVELQEKKDGEKPSAGLSKKAKKDDVGENHEEKFKKQHVNNKGFKVVGKKLKKNSITEWVEKLAEKKYTNLTLKKEIMEMVTTKIEQHETARAKKGHNGIPEFMTYDEIASNAPVKEPTTKPATPTTKPGTKPRRKSPYQPGPGTNPRPKAMGDNKLK